MEQGRATRHTHSALWGWVGGCTGGGFTEDRRGGSSSRGRCQLRLYYVHTAAASYATMHCGLEGKGGHTAYMVLRTLGIHVLEGWGHAQRAWG